MAKKKEEITEAQPGGPLPGPDRAPQPGDVVNYIYHENAGTAHRDKIYPAAVKLVHEGHDGRLLNIEVEQPDGPQRIGPVTYRAHEKDAPAGNTWHWPEEKSTASA
jgi:hypothetical protein